jgi:hypothetical protein
MARAQRKATKRPREKPAKAATEIEFDFIKSNFFRVVRADGAFGGLSPTGAIHMAIYSERQPLPQKIVHRIEDGTLGPEMADRRQGRKAIVREVEVDVVLEIAQAIVLRTWLEDKINQYQQLIGPLPVIPSTTKVVSSASNNPPKERPRGTNNWHDA